MGGEAATVMEQLSRLWGRSTARQLARTRMVALHTAYRGMLDVRGGAALLTAWHARVLLLTVQAWARAVTPVSTDGDCRHMWW